MKTYTTRSERERHAAKLLHALSGLNLGRQETQASLEICLYKLGAIYRDFDQHSVDTRGFCELVESQWETLTDEEKLSQLFFLSAMQGMEEELDKQIVEQSLKPVSDNQRQIA
jgi:hypothetical protein